MHSHAPGNRECIVVRAGIDDENSLCNGLNTGNRARDMGLFIVGQNDDRNIGLGAAYIPSPACQAALSGMI
ncbi:hypothetical protein [Altericroceibacterium indicum]|uniref:hypothetical protein n=1 Tax=Altericroceibacterium indicum TaxID=374177 RepID=UPI0031B5EB04